ncbi:MAG: hypothetical protein J2P45_21890 [Candidatus Dormibacteraeota bacterium]|nr:hypothetical protein [Candidatus Dormibacteraeota bacterium]
MDANGTAGANPYHIVEVRELEPLTVSRVIAQLEVSTEFEHLVYRESELDALWSLADMAARAGRPGAERALALLWQAHDQVGDGRPAEAVEALAELRDLLSS